MFVCWVYLGQLCLGLDSSPTGLRLTAAVLFIPDFRLLKRLWEAWEAHHQ